MLTVPSHINVIVPDHSSNVRCQENVIILRTGMMARACLDEHHLLCEDVSLWTAELDLGCDCCVRCAAATVCADTTELWFVQPGAGTA